MGTKDKRREKQRKKKNMATMFHTDLRPDSQLFFKRETHKNEERKKLRKKRKQSLNNGWGFFFFFSLSLCLKVIIFQNG